jgi:hypothetical protein
MDPKLKEGRARFYERARRDFDRDGYFAVADRYGTHAITKSAQPGVAYQVTRLDLDERPTGHTEAATWEAAASQLWVESLPIEEKERYIPRSPLKRRKKRKAKKGHRVKGKFRASQRVADLEYIPAAIPEEEKASVLARLKQIPGRGKTSYVGAGMTSLVFCDEHGKAYKIARRGAGGTLETEAEWLATANQVPGLKERVAKLDRYDPKLDVIVRSCPKPIERSKQRRGKLWDLWREIGARIEPYGWTAPEYKEDSFVITRSGPVLVDAGFTHRTGRRLLAHTKEIVSGKRELPKGERWADLAFALRREVGLTLTDAQVRPTIAKIAARDPSASEWLSSL